MSELAKEILKKAKEEKATFVDLGNCGLDGYLPDELFDEYFIENLEGLSLGNVTKNYLDIDWEDKWVTFLISPIKYYYTPNKGKKNNFKQNSELERISNFKRLTNLMIANEYNNPGELRTMDFIGNCNHLIELHLVNNQIKKIKGLNGNVRILDLGGNEINSIVGLNKNLQSLNLSGNKISKIEGLNENLQKLYLSRNQISNIEGLNENLQTLDLNLNQIRKIVNLTDNLQTLYLNENRITKIERLNKNLQSLYLYNNQISKIEELNENLKTLVLGGNQISKIEGLNENLQELYLTNNQISKIEELNENLKTLVLDGNQISKIEGLNENLQELYLTNNQISKIEELNENLKTLVLDENQISKIEGLNENLQTLDLSNNRISKIEGLHENLRTLFLRTNGIKKIEGLSDKLETLSLGGNQIQKIEGLPENLQTISLRYNLIENIKPLLTFLNREKNKLRIVLNSKSVEQSEVNIFGNPLIEPPMEVVEQGNEAIIRYFQDIEKQGAEYLYEAKMLIVGQPRAGKTSLRYKLQNIDIPLPEEEMTTRGIDIEKLEFDITDDEGNQRKFYYSIWDFGGQQIYYSTHQFFLTCRSLYVLVVDSGKDITGNEDPTINYWLQAVELMGKGNDGKSSPLLIVSNEKNDRKIDINLPQKKERFDFLEKEYKVNLNALRKDSSKFSSERVRDFSELQDFIKLKLKNLPLVGFPMPKNSVRIREELFELAKTTPFISSYEYFKICEKHDVTDYIRQIELSSVLHDLGAILYFKDYPALEDIIILQNLWVTGAVFAILDSKEIQESKGKFTKTFLSQLWNEKDYPGNVHNKLLALMMKFELCYEIKDAKETSYIVPELLSVEPPFNYKWEPNNDLILEYRYDFMPKGLLTKLIVRMNENIAKENNDQIVWKSGVKIDGKDLDCPNTYAEIQEKWDNKQLSIRVQGSISKDLMTIVSREIDKLNNEYFRLVKRGEESPKSQWYKMIPCNCKVCIKSDDKHFYDYSKLIERKEFGKDTIECEKKPYENVGINSLIEGVFSEKKNENIKKKMIITGKKKIFLSYSHKDEDFKEKLDTHFSGLKRNEKIETWNDRKIAPGTEWDDEIKNEMREADIILLLISSDFIASDYIWNTELSFVMERQKNGECVIAPVIIRHCDWKELEFAKKQVMPRDGKPVTKYADEDEAFTEIVEGIKKLI